MLISLLLCWPLGPHVWPLPSKSQWAAVNLPCGCLGGGAVRTLVLSPTLQCTWAPQVMSHIHDWLTWGPNFKTLCNHMLPFLFHPSLKAGEISLAMNVWNSLPASGPRRVCNKHWMKVCPVSWLLPGAERRWVEDADEATFLCLVHKESQTHPGWILVAWLLESQIVVQGPAASSSPGSLLEMKTLSPPTNGWITTCTFTRSPEDPHAL